MNYLSRKSSVILKIARNDRTLVYSTFVQLAVRDYPVKMKLSLFPVTVLLKKAKYKKRRKWGRSECSVTAFVTISRAWFLGRQVSEVYQPPSRF